MTQHVASCPLCGSVHNVPFFDEKESEAIQCMTCRGWFHYVQRNKSGQFGTRVAARMNDSTKGQQ